MYINLLDINDISYTYTYVVTNYQDHCHQQPQRPILSLIRKTLDPQVLRWPSASPWAAVPHVALASEASKIIEASPRMGD